MRLFNWQKYLESVGSIPIDDIEKYFDGMELGAADKLFFMTMVNPDIIVDFGCADGTILSKIKGMNPNIRLVGYDLDKNMLVNARKKIGDDCLLTSDWNEVIEEVSKYTEPAMILSSVIHEVYSYSTTATIRKFWQKQVFGNLFKWICIRDMIPSGAMEKHNKFQSDVEKVRKIADPYYLNSFESRWDDIGENYRTFIHFLLKYKYVENWNREVNENYVPIILETLYKKIPSNYKINFQENYILPFLQTQVQNDFGVTIDHITHTKMIIENKSFI